MPIKSNTLTSRAMRMAVMRIGLVAVAASVVSYFVNSHQIENSVRAQLLISTQERLQREAIPFIEIENRNRNGLEAVMALVQNTARHDELLGMFDQFFVLRSDGAWVSRDALFDGVPLADGHVYRHLTAALNPGVPLTRDLKIRMAASVLVVEDYGNQGQGRHLDFGIIFPEGGLTLYWPGFRYCTDLVFEGPKAYRMQDQDWFKIGFAKPGPGHSRTRMYLDTPSGNWLVSIVGRCAPGPDGFQPVSTITDLSLANLMERTAKPSISGTDNIVFRADEEGSLIVHAELREAIVKSDGRASITSTGNTELLPLLKEVTSPTYEAGAPRIVSAPKHIIAYGVIPGTDWVLAVRYPKALMRPAILSNLGIVAAVGLVTLLVEIFLLRSILQNQVSRPLAQLIGATRRLGEPGSDFDVGQLPPSSPDEVGRLSESFRLMAGQLRTSFAFIRAGEEKFHAMLEASPLAISWMNSRGEMEFWNRKALTLFGYDREEIDTVEKWFNLAYPDPEYRKAVIERWNASGAAGPDGHIDRGEYDITCKDGRIVTTEIVGTRLGDLTLAIFNDITERKRAEEELRRSEARFKLLSDVSPLAIVVAEGPDQSFEYMNPKFTELLGYTREDLPDVSRWWPQAYPDVNYRRQVMDEWTWKVTQASLSKTHITEPVESEVTCKDGSIKTMLWGFAVVSDNKSVIFGMDLTARKKAERELKLVSDRLQVATSAADIGIWEWDLGRNELLWDDAMYRLYGIHRDDFTGAYDAWIRALHPEDEKRIDAAIQAALRGEREYNEEFRIIRPDGSLRFIKAAGQTFRDADGKPIRMVGVNYDITERRLAEEELRKSEASLKFVSNRMQVAAKAGNIGIWDWDIVTDELIWDDTMYRHYGFRAEDFVALFETWYNSLHPEDIERTMEGIRAALRGEKEYNEEFRVIHPDGSLHHLHSASRTFRDVDGNPIRMVGVSYDITEHKLAENELLRHRDHLEELVSARTAELSEANASLEEARRAAEKANRLKSEFLANMSHEIRTPMNGVLGMAELLSRTPLEAGQREQLAMLRGSGEDLLTIINDILDFSKIEAGRLELEAIGLSLHDLFGRTLQALTTQAAAKKLEIELDIPDDLPDLRLGDPNRLRQVLSNLVGNSIKFTERGWVRVVVTQGPGPHGLRVEVIDTGEGISLEAQAKLFKPFSQADSSTTRKHGGTGLGLVISARIIEQMGGRIGVTSAPGCGSTFWFELSLPPATPEQVAPEVRMPDALPLLAGKRVLLVDDNAVNRAVAGALMRRWDMKVSEAADGPAALAQVRAASRVDDLGYDLAVLDGAMPGMDGWRLAEAIREIPGYDALPMVMASSSSFESSHTPEENSLFKRFLIKPLRPAQLAGALAEALSGWQPDRAAPISTTASGARVLLVEDTKVNQMVAQAMLEKGGHQVTLAGNGVEALAQLEQPDLFDIILMDCQMPEMDGFEATRQLRQRERDRGWKPYRVVAMTANAMESDKQACLDAGMDDYLSKPVRMDQLLKTVTGE